LPDVVWRFWSDKSADVTAGRLLGSFMPDSHCASGSVRSLSRLALP